MRSAVAIVCAIGLFACSRETEVADVDTTTVSATSATVDTSATSTSATIYDVFDIDRNDNITREELRQRWWDLFDGNDDNMIDASEWRARTGAS